jgi:hypothetical protein
MANNESPSLLSGLATKAVALVVLIVAAWILFKLVIGVVTTVAVVLAVVAGIVAVFWAVSILRR